MAGPDRELERVTAIFAGFLDVKAKLGQGAMGAVYRVERDGRPLALKVLLPGSLEDEATKERFALEGKVLMAMNHPNIMRVEDIGERDKRPYLLCELVVGQSLDEILKKEGAFEWKRAFAIVEQVLLGLEAAHQKKIIHRDIKPANILMEAGDKVKIGDFGIAKAEEMETHKTTTGMIVGTPAYIAPELLRGAKATPRADLFSVGVMLYELLAGELPWPSATPDQLLTARLEKTVPRLSNKLEGVPKAIDVLVENAMTPEVVDRFPTARTFLTALEKTRASLIQNVEGAQATSRMVVDRSKETAVVMRKRQAGAGLAPLDAPRVSRRVSTRVPIPAAPVKAGMPPWLIPAVGGLLLVTVAFVLGTRRGPAPPPVSRESAAAARLEPLDGVEEQQLQQLVGASVGTVFEEALAVLTASTTLEKDRIARILHEASTDVSGAGALMKRFRMVEELVKLQSPLAIGPVVMVMREYDQLAAGEAGKAGLQAKLDPLARSLDPVLDGSGDAPAADPAEVPDHDDIRRDLCLVLGKVANSEPGWRQEKPGMVRAAIRILAWLGDPKTDCLLEIENAPMAAGWLGAGLAGDDPDAEVTRLLLRIDSDAARTALQRRGVAPSPAAEP